VQILQRLYSADWLAEETSTASAVAAAATTAAAAAAVPAADVAADSLLTYDQCVVRGQQRAAGQTTVYWSER